MLKRQLTLLQQLRATLGSVLWSLVVVVWGVLGECLFWFCCWVFCFLFFKWGEKLVTCLY